MEFFPYKDGGDRNTLVSQIVIFIPMKFSLFTIALMLSSRGLSQQFECSDTSAAVKAFEQDFYDASSGIWQGGQPPSSTWNWANSLTALCDYMLLSRPALNQYGSNLPNTFLKVQEMNLANNQTALNILQNTNPTPAVEGGFIDGFYDDNGWWALAWIKAYDLTSNQPYLDAAEQIFDEMTTGWDDVCNGGIWWTTGRTYKNAISNELFLSVAASLANRDSENKTYYLDWAVKELTWFQQSGMMNSAGTINDGLNPDCTNNGQTTWSYNQGVILGGLVELNKASPQSSYIQYANGIASAAIANLTVNGILHETCEPNCGGGSNFKGIFIRNLIELYNVSPQSEYQTLILANAESLWNSDRYSNETFGDDWSGPLDDVNVMSETAAIDLLVAAYEISNCHGN